MQYTGMELGNRIIHFRITAVKDVTIPDYNPDHETLLFGDIDIPIGMFISYKDSTEYLVIFQSDITELSKFIGTTK